ncbi:glycosyltransferase family 2 protein [Streptomyces sp. STCH 565 A]|uniref:glycosyltransferase family 2 protein n=1 Tax=Streptomyces sp. STCH 565 A TaxID=2950532 RepID=UPI002075696F|nr:glycosyltransferase family 2 protein [Streptomyces sp. STCH 565 A]MCM8548917.1 glycosyltransferase family 2 protein [Streptomyces sp. STCH 565 A]
MTTLTQPGTLSPATARTPRVIALIPARNERERIAAAIAGLQAQTRVPDEIIAVTNNCTDQHATREAARDAGAWVLDLHGVRGKKAGALNMALDEVLPTLDDQDLILIQDADTVLTPGFLAHAAAGMRRRVGAVGGVFYGEPGGGLLGQLQRMEYQRYAWEIGRRGDRATVLTGTASLFRVRVLRQIKAARIDGRLPGGSSYYTIDSLTEDDEITKAVRTLGYRTMSPAPCRVTTEVMTTVPALWNQRLRWQRGALENLRSYGLTRVTARYWGQQIMMGLGALAFALYLVFVALQLIYLGALGISPFWTAIGAIFVVEKVASVWRAGWRSRLLASVLVVELVYDLFQHAVYFRALLDLALRREEQWVAT